MKNKVTTFLWFKKDAIKAAKFYKSIFKKSKIIDQNPMTVTMDIEGHRFTMLNGGAYYKLTPAMSFFVSCRDQKEIDYYYNRLAKGGKTLQCGWLTDQFGVTWQIIPEILGDLLGNDNEGRAMQAMLKMKKLDIKKLKEAHSN